LRGASAGCGQAIFRVYGQPPPSVQFTQLPLGPPLPPRFLRAGRSRPLKNRKGRSAPSPQKANPRTPVGGCAFGMSQILSSRSAMAGGRGPPNLEPPSPCARSPLAGRAQPHSVRATGGLGGSSPPPTVPQKRKREGARITAQDPLASSRALLRFGTLQGGCRGWDGLAGVIRGCRGFFSVKQCQRLQGPCDRGLDDSENRGATREDTTLIPQHLIQSPTFTSSTLTAITPIPPHGLALRHQALLGVVPDFRSIRQILRINPECGRPIPRQSGGSQPRVDGSLQPGTLGIHADDPMPCPPALPPITV
jgi:hypothetical protein